MIDRKIMDVELSGLVPLMEDTAETLYFAWDLLDLLEDAGKEMLIDCLVRVFYCTVTASLFSPKPLY